MLVPAQQVSACDFNSAVLGSSDESNEKTESHLLEF